MGGDPKMLFAPGKACGRQSTKAFIREMLYFNQFRKFSPEKVLIYSIDKVIVRVTTPTHHAHEPLGMQILARTLSDAATHSAVESAKVFYAVLWLKDSAPAGSPESSFGRPVNTKKDTN